VPIEVKMAKLSPTMESGQMVRWLVKVGDAVREGDTLAEIQTDKAVMPMEAFDEGVVALLDVGEGEDIALGQRVLVLARKGEDAGQVAAQLGKGGGGAPAGTTSQSVAVHKDFDSQEETNTPNTPEHAQRGAIGNGQAPGVAAPTTASTSSPSGGRPRSTPLARKIAAEAKVEIGTIPGTGPNGRVIRRDVDAFLARRPAAAPTTAAPAPAAPAKKSPAPADRPARVPHSPMRKTIAKRMLESSQGVPAIHVTVDVRMDKLMAIREAMNASPVAAKAKVRISVSDFITKAVALALRQHPGVNASWEADAVVSHPEVNVGIAVAMDGGLMVPVLRNADTLGLLGTRLGTEEIVQATRAGSLKPHQMMGGTFTISNLGMYGVKQFDAIINLPEVAILAVGAGEKRPVVDGDALAVGTVMSVTLTADHRAVDGALAAEFLLTFKGYLEDPATMLL